jgi:hypothetical protein
MLRVVRRSIFVVMHRSRVKSYVKRSGYGSMVATHILVLCLDLSCKAAEKALHALVVALNSIQAN